MTARQACEAAGPPLSPRLLPQAIGLQWHQQKYAQPGESVADTQSRVAQALSLAESPEHRQAWAHRFEAAMIRGLLPAGRIMTGAGVGPKPACLMNCFVLPAQPLAELASRLRATLREGGGVGVDYSVLPRGVMQALKQAEAVAQSLEHPLRAGRRAAQMAVLQAEHPEVDAFIAASPDDHPHITRSVAVDDAFMRVAQQHPKGPQAHRLSLMARHIASSGEPGLIFSSRVQADDNLGEDETLTATNPCGEQPLPPFGACALASIDLTRIVQDPFAPNARVAWGLLAALTHTAVRLLDNALTLSHWPLIEQARQAQRWRRIGLGITGLADALALLNLHYAAPPARQHAAQIMRFMAHAAYRASVRLARERGTYPGFQAGHTLAAGHFASRLPLDLRHDIRRHGLRHSHLLALAPAASISMAFADAVSTGVEPMTAPQWERRWRDPSGQACSAWVQSHALRVWRLQGGLRNEPPLPWAWLESISPVDQIAMVAALAPHVDGGISKTVSLPPATTVDEIKGLIQLAWAQGLKGVTLFRRGSRASVVAA